MLKKIQLLYFILLALSGIILLFVEQIFAICLLICSAGYLLKNGIFNSKPESKNSRLGLILQLIGASGILIYTIIKFYLSQDA